MHLGFNLLVMATAVVGVMYAWRRRARLGRKSQ
jgi:hypothetical protein